MPLHQKLIKIPLKENTCSISTDIFTHHRAQYPSCVREKDVISIFQIFRLSRK